MAQLDIPRIIHELPTLEMARKAMKGRPRKHLKYLWLDVARKVHIRTRAAEAQNWRCCWCSRPMTEQPERAHSVTREHVVPRSLGGDDSYDNIAAACLRCNNARGVMTAEEFMEHVASLGWVDKNPAKNS